MRNGFVERHRFGRENGIEVFFTVCYTLLANQLSARGEAGYRNRFRFWRPGVRIPPGGPHLVRKALIYKAFRAFLLRFYDVSNSIAWFLSIGKKRRHYCLHIASINLLTPTMLIALVKLYARKLSPSSAAAFSFPLHKT